METYLQSTVPFAGQPSIIIAYPCWNSTTVTAFHFARLYLLFLAWDSLLLSSAIMISNRPGLGLVHHSLVDLLGRPLGSTTAQYERPVELVELVHEQLLTIQMPFQFSLFLSHHPQVPAEEVFWKCTTLPPVWWSLLTPYDDLGHRRCSPSALVARLLDKLLCSIATITSNGHKQLEPRAVSLYII